MDIKRKELQDLKIYEKDLDVFNKYLSVWVAICILSRTLLGYFFPSLSTSLSQIEFANVSLPVLFGITVASSFAFLLPMGTPPNVLVYEKDKISIKDMFVNGVVLNFIAIAKISIFTTFISQLLLSWINVVTNYI